MVKQLLNDNLTLQISDLQVHFPVSKGLVKAVDGISARFEHGKITGIIGESGCGKSVLGQALLGLLPDYVMRSGQNPLPWYRYFGKRRWNPLLLWTGIRTHTPKSR